MRGAQFLFPNLAIRSVTPSPLGSSERSGKEASGVYRLMTLHMKGNAKGREKVLPTQGELVPSCPKDPIIPLVP